MKIIRPMQFIFTRVEAEFSATRQSGYQVYYASPGLDENSRSEIEGQVKTLQATDLNVVRWQYFITANQLTVIARSAFITTDPRISDRSSRTGIFLCHAVILTSTQMSDFGNNPFAILPQVAFLCDPRQMVAEYRPLEGVERAISLDPSLLPTLSPGAVSWELAARRLAPLAMSAPAARAKGQQVLLIGTQQRVLEALEALFWLAPASARSVMTFNTFVSGTSSEPTRYWAAATATYTSGYPLMVRLSETHSVELPQEIHFEPNGYYAAWLTSALSQKGTRLFGRLPAVQEMAAAFEQRREFSIERADLSTAQEFYRYFKADFDARLSRLIADQANDALVDPLRAFILETTDLRQVIGWLAEDQPHPKRLALMAQNWVLQRAVGKLVLESNAWPGLAKLAKKAGNHVLGFWAAAAQRKIKEANENLEAMTDEEYEIVLKLLFVFFPPREFACKKHASRLIALIGKDQPPITQEDFYDLVSDLLDFDRGDGVGPLAWKVDDLDEKTFTRLEKRIRKSKGLSNEFLQAVQQKRKTLRPKPAFWKKFILRKKEDHNGGKR